MTPHTGAGDALSQLRDIVPVEAPARYTRDNAAIPVSANAHIHLPPNFSAFEGITQAVALAAAHGIQILGASNYYEYSIYGQFASDCLRRNVYPLFGLEVIALLAEVRESGVLINDPANPGKMYLCGKGITHFDPMTREAERLLGFIRHNDTERMQQVTSRVAECFRGGGLTLDLDYDTIVERVVLRHGVPREYVVLQERHVAQAFQEECFRAVPLSARPAALERVTGARLRTSAADAVAVQNEIRAHLMKARKPAFVEERFVSFEEARRLVLELGGIPCYPTLADGTTPICGYEDPPEKLIQTLRGLGVYCAEFIPVRNQPAVLERYVRAFRSAGFVVTAGTEHNTLDMIPMRPACTGRAPVPAGLESLFAEGACVAVAHQFLGMTGQAGYVDRAGELNPDFPDSEERIAFFRNLGAAVIAGVACAGQL